MAHKYSNAKATNAMKINTIVCVCRKYACKGPHAASAFDMPDRTLPFKKRFSIISYIDEKNILCTAIIASLGFATTARRRVRASKVYGRK